MSARLLALVLPLLALPLPASAADGPVGIAFAQREEGLWACTGTDAKAVIDCAMTKCETEGAADGGCVATRWCFPMQAVGSMTVWLGDFHATEVHCATSEDALRPVMAAACKANPDATTCQMTATFGEDGAAKEVDESFEGGATN